MYQLRWPIKRNGFSCCKFAEIRRDFNIFVYRFLFKMSIEMSQSTKTIALANRNGTDWNKNWFCWIQQVAWLQFYKLYGYWILLLHDRFSSVLTVNRKWTWFVKYNNNKNKHSHLLHVTHRIVIYIFSLLILRFHCVLFSARHSKKNKRNRNGN